MIAACAVLLANTKLHAASPLGVCAGAIIANFSILVLVTHLKYVRPATYGQALEVRTQLLEHENRLKIGYEIVDCASGTRLTKGYTIQVAVDAATQELQFVSPPVVFEKLERVWGR